MFKTITCLTTGHLSKRAAEQIDKIMRMVPQVAHYVLISKIMLFATKLLTASIKNHGIPNNIHSKTELLCDDEPIIGRKYQFQPHYKHSFGL